METTNEEKIEKKLMVTLENFHKCKKKIEEMSVNVMMFEGIEELTYLEVMTNGFNDMLTHHYKYIKENPDDLICDEVFLEIMESIQVQIDKLEKELSPIFLKYKQELIL